MPTPSPAIPSLIHYAALLETPETRAALCAIHDLRATLQDAARSGHHPEARQARLAWWRRELAGLDSGEVSHPAARAVLRERRGARSAHAAVWQSLLDALEQEACGKGIVSEAAFLDRATVEWGPILQHATPVGDARPTQDWLAAFAGALFRAEAILDIGRDAASGHLRLPETGWMPAGLHLSGLTSNPPDPAWVTLLTTEAEAALARLRALPARLPPQGQRALRPMVILAALYGQRLLPISRDGRHALPRALHLAPLRAWFIAVRTGLPL